LELPTATLPRPRPDFAAIQRWQHDSRPLGEIVAQYQRERRLAERLKSASPAERARLYTEINAEPTGAQVAPPHDATEHDAAARAFQADLRILARFVTPQMTFLDIGCGDAVIPFAMARLTAVSIGLDVTDRRIDHAAAPANFRFLHAGGSAIGLPDETVDFVSSNQVMEHLHPDDAVTQLREVHRVLKPGGRYLCRTPNRLTGPHDVSCHFDYEATGAHIREYDCRAIAHLLHAARFRRVSFLLIVRHRLLGRVPQSLQALAEAVLEPLPRPLRTSVRALKLLRPLLGVNALAEK